MLQRKSFTKTLALALAPLMAPAQPAAPFKKTSDNGSQSVRVAKAPRAGRPVPASPKISQRLSQRAATGDGSLIPVMIVFKHQPQAAIMEQLESLAAPQHDLAIAELGRVRGFSQRAEDQVHSRIERLTLDTRSAAKREIEMQIGDFQKTKAAALEAAGAANVRAYWSQNIITAEVPANALDMLAQDGDIAEVVPEPVLKLSADVTNATIDPNVGVLGMAAWWNAGFKGNGQQVVVLDTGINATHPVFAGKDVVAKVFMENARRSRCFADDASSPKDNTGHGTHVAGIIAGASEALLPSFQGTAPGVNRIFSLKVGGKFSGVNDCPDNSLMSGDILAGMDWALANTSAKIFNMSFGAETEAEDSAFARTFDRQADAFGLTLLIAAGNSGPQGIGDTGLTYNAITVANWDTRGTLNKDDDRVSASSSRGPTAGGRFKPDVAAPGTQILSASHLGSGFIRFSGTSMAAPKVAGVAAVLHQAGLRNPAAIKALLINTTDQVGWKEDRGWGFVNMEFALAPKTLLAGEVTPAGTPGSFALFRGRNTGDFYATMAWNRHMSGNTPIFSDLDLRVYDAAGNELGVSESAVQNVEQIATQTDGDVIVKVKAFDESFGGLTSEKFALAVSQSQFSAVTGPAIEARCTPSSTTVSRGGEITLTCSVTNKGDLDGAGTTAELKLSGSSDSLNFDLGALAAGESRSGTFRVTAPGQAGTMELVWSASTNAAGETMSGSSLLQIAVR